MSRLKDLLPKGLIWRISLINILVITVTIGLSGWAVYHTACFLAGGFGNFGTLRQQQFNSTFLQYVITFGVIGLVVGSLLHFYLIKKLLKPVRELIISTKQLKEGTFPERIRFYSDDEVGQLVEQYNGLIIQLQKNEKERTKLVSDVSHEFRTPLSNLNGYLYALKSGAIKGEQKIYRSLYSEVNRLTHLIDDIDKLKEWNHISSQAYSNKSRVNIKEQINQCVDMFELTLDKEQIPFDLKVDEQELVINVEGFQQVLCNLIDNAIRYYEGDSAIQLTGLQLVDSYKISVCGPGEAINQDEAEKIFKRFYRIEESRNDQTGGSGLGLSIAKEIVEKHGGDIGLIPGEHKNTFWFTLPSSN